MLNLGTKKHRDKYYEGIDNLEYTGCFAMTELHHGILFFWRLLMLLCFIIFPSLPFSLSLSLSILQFSCYQYFLHIFRVLGQNAAILLIPTHIQK